MDLNASRLMPSLSARYCGITWYFSNSLCHCASLSGGTTPVTGLHSVIERPDSVSRVAPPTSTLASTSAAMAQSHSRIARVCCSEGFLAGMLITCRKRADHIVLRPALATELMPLHNPARHVNPFAQIHWCHCAVRAGRGVGAAGDGFGASAGHSRQFRAVGRLLCDRRPWLGCAGHANRRLDGTQRDAGREMTDDGAKSSYLCCLRRLSSGVCPLLPARRQARNHAAAMVLSGRAQLGGLGCTHKGSYEGSRNNGCPPRRYARCSAIRSAERSAADRPDSKSLCAA